MLFNSYEFIFVFLPLVFFGYYWLGKYSDKEYSLVWLVVASLFFYAWWNVAYLVLIIASIVYNYLTGYWVSKQENRFRKPVLVLGVVTNLSLLGYYKYANFFIDNISRIADVNWNMEVIILPLAISFFTFQQITYLIDAYKGETKEYSFIHYALFVSFFPQLIAGPIVHHKEMMPQFLEKRRSNVDYAMIAAGLTIFFLGLFKKVVIADTVSKYAIETFSVTSSGVMLSFFEAWFGALSYTFQLYFDFSGYSDMAIGAAALFGIRLPLNFSSPYKSESIIEFWRRWHITLSRFLKDYLYIPLGGNRKGSVRRYINIFITMLLGGLWHGAGWTYVVWGAMHGCLIIVNHWWRDLMCHFYSGFNSSRFFRLFSRLLTFLVVVIAWVVFRSDDLPSAWVMIQSLFGQAGFVWPEQSIGELGSLASSLQDMGMQVQYLEHFNGLSNMSLMLFLLVSVWLLPNVHQLFHQYSVALYSPEQSRLRWMPDKRWVAVITVVALLAIVKLGHVSEFLYFQF